MPSGVVPAGPTTTGVLAGTKTLVATGVRSLGSESLGLPAELGREMKTRLIMTSPAVEPRTVMRAPLPLKSKRGLAGLPTILWTKQKPSMPVWFTPWANSAAVLSNAVL